MVLARSLPETVSFRRFITFLIKDFSLASKITCVHAELSCFTIAFDLDFNVKVLGLKDGYSNV